MRIIQASLVKLLDKYSGGFTLCRKALFVIKQGRYNYGS
ncbi:hypothetical protein PTET_a1061 [Pseudoalteromonas tetraodonis]|nr:hypothetical protein PTET_a1061 [Pseudoalteromonas tetraodonis]